MFYYGLCHKYPNQPLDCTHTSTIDNHNEKYTLKIKHFGLMLSSGLLEQEQL